MYLINLAWFMGTGTLSEGVSTPPKRSSNVPMCLRNFQNQLVHGALMEAEIPPHSPCICSSHPSFEYWHSACRCVNTSHVIWKCFSVSQEPTKMYLVHGALIEAEILTSLHPNIFAQLVLVWALVLHPQMCQHFPSGMKYSYLCQEPPNKIWCWGSNES